jgi:hypothetical protein
LGVQKWAVWSIVSNNVMRDTRPLLYTNMADLVTSYIPFFFWTILFVLLFYILYKMDVKAIAIVAAWGHQIWYWLSGILGLRQKEKDDDLFKNEKKPKKSSS